MRTIKNASRHCQTSLGGRITLGWLPLRYNNWTEKWKCVKNVVWWLLIFYYQLIPFIITGLLGEDAAGAVITTLTDAEANERQTVLPLGHKSLLIPTGEKGLTQPTPEVTSYVRFLPNRETFYQTRNILIFLVLRKLRACLKWSLLPLLAWIYLLSISCVRGIHPLLEELPFEGPGSVWLSFVSFACSYCSSG